MSITVKPLLAAMQTEQQNPLDTLFLPAGLKYVKKCFQFPTYPLRRASVNYIWPLLCFKVSTQFEVHGLSLCQRKVWACAEIS